MNLDIRPITPDELPAFLRNDALAFGGQIDPDEIEEVRASFEFDRSLAAFEDGQIVGTAGAYAFELTLPGLTVTPVAGVSWVAVRPTHRRRGILRALMARQLDDVAERGEALAVLTASESGIYARFGYGVANSSMTVEIDPHYAAFRRPPAVAGRLRLIDREEALSVLPAIYDRARRLQPGALSRSHKRWQEMLAQSAQMDRRDGPRFYVVHESPTGEIDGAAVYRIREEWQTGFAANVLRVRDVMAMTPEVYASLWHYLLNVDLVGTVRAADRPLDEPLRWLLVEPRRQRVADVGDELWARVLDVPAALGARRYGVSATLVLEVRDAFRPHQQGRYVLDGSPEGADCSRTDAPADLVLDVADLGATYLGGVSFSALARAGRVEEITPGAIRRADALFAAEQAPYCGTHF